MTELDRCRQAVDRISLEKPEIKGSLLFYSDMLSLLYELANEISGELNGSKELFIGLAKKVSEEGKPLLELIGQIPLTRDVWLKTLEAVISKVKEHRADLVEDLEEIMDAAKRNSFNIEDLAMNSLKGDLNYARGVAAGLNVDLDLVNALALWTIQPLLISLRKMVEPHIKVDGWFKGYCPVCGSYTRTGFMRGEGRKLHLKCEICGMEWPFQRLKCPFCGNEDEKKLGFYSFDDEKFRLYICEECNEYWKVVDEETAGSSIPRELYPVWTFELDEEAARLRERA